MNLQLETRTTILSSIHLFSLLFFGSLPSVCYSIKSIVGWSKNQIFLWFSLKFPAEVRCNAANLETKHKLKIQTSSVYNWVKSVLNDIFRHIYTAWIADNVCTEFLCFLSHINTQLSHSHKNMNFPTIKQIAHIPKIPITFYESGPAELSDVF